ncbi:MAG TPA: hypothetical protein VGA20_03060 [Gemmatimonadales bacterium]
MPKGSSKSTATIERLLEERRQYEAWIARLDAAGDTTPDNVRIKVRADYHARLLAVIDELKAHAEQARQLIAQKKERLGELAQLERDAADRMKETELRHAVGEYDETQWTQVHRDAMAELMAVREELKATEGDISKLEELDRLVRTKPGPVHVGDRVTPRSGGAARSKNDDGRKTQVDELAFLKSVTEDERTGPSPRRASGAQFQPVIPDITPRTPATPNTSTPASDDGHMDGEKTLKCRDCGTLNLPTEWYCEQCGAELAAL